MVVPLPEAPLPDRIGQFRILGVLGRGGMGVVYRAVDAGGQVVAVKTASMVLRGRLEGVRSEILALERLQHPRIIKILAHGFWDGIPWYAMELLEGRTLSSILHELWSGRWSNAATIETSRPTQSSTNGEPGPLREAPRGGASARSLAAGGRLREILTLFRKLCAPLAYLHARGMVHRDLKPSNVFVRKDGTPVLMDFGLISRARGAVGREALEASGRLVGTAPYLAPEQIRLEAVDARTDLYALGCMLYQAITGFVPHGARTVSELLRRQTTETPLRPAELVQGVDPSLDELVMRLLAKRRRDRLGHADDVAAALARLGAVEDASIEASPARTYLYRPEMAGREAAREQMEAALGRLSAGTGGFILVGGESGIGKTFLVSEAARLSAVRDLRVVTGECLPANVGSTTGLEVRGAPMHPIRSLFHAIADLGREGGRKRVERLLGPHARVLAPYAPFFAELPGAADLPAVEDLPAEASHRRVLDSAAEVLSAFVAEGPPVVLVIDDLQWSDELTLSLLDSLTGAYVEDRPLLIIATFRSDETTPGIRTLLARPGIVRLDLDRLRDGDIERLVADMLGVDRVEPALARFVAQRSEGNPFFAAEYLRIAVAERILYREDGDWRVTSGATTPEGLDRLPLPRSIQALIEKHVGELSPPAARLIEVASVLGRTAPTDLLSVVAEVEPDATEMYLKELQQHQVFEVDEHGNFGFVHDKLREVTYARIPPERARALHRSAALVLEQRLTGATTGRMSEFGLLAHHYLRAELWTRAIDFLELAGERAMRDFSNREAIGYFKNAVELEGRLPGGMGRLRRARWEGALMDAHLALGQRETAMTHAGRALALCGEPLPKRGIGWKWGVLVQIAVRGLQRLAPWLFRVRAPTRKPLIVEASYVLNRTVEPYFLSGQNPQGFYSGLKNLNLAERVEPSESLARGYATMAMVAGVGPLVPVARVWSGRAVSLARSIGKNGLSVFCLARASSMMMTIPDWAGAGEAITEAVRLGRDGKDKRQLEEALVIDCLRFFYRGQLTRSLEIAREVYESGSQRGDTQMRHWAMNLMVQALGRLGREGEAASVMDRMRAWLEKQAGAGERTFCYGNFSIVNLNLGDVGHAQEDADRALAAMRRDRPVSYFMVNPIAAICETYLGLWGGVVDAEPSRRRPLRAAALEACGIFDRFAGMYAFARPVARYCRALALWNSGRPRAASAAMLRALEEARAYELGYWTGRAHLQLGRRGEGAEARAHLEKAQEIFTRIEAAHDTRQVATALQEGK